jgi:hypothetical protein
VDGSEGPGPEEQSALLAEHLSQTPTQPEQEATASDVLQQQQQQQEQQQQTADVGRVGRGEDAEGRRCGGGRGREGGGSGRGVDRIGQNTCSAGQVAVCARWGGGWPDL